MTELFDPPGSRPSRYADDPLVQARKVHRPKYLGHPDGRCCIGCEGETYPPANGHVLWPCPVLREGRCSFEFGDYQCIQTHHGDETHLVEDRYGNRMVVTSPTDDQEDS